MATYKIGTRGSLLAVTQSTLMKNELERISGETFELVLIKTQGDEITNKPLWQLDGKDFFTKELDEALLKGEVDLVIHSYKDLGSVRPEGIKLAAVTERKFAHDILLIKKDLAHNLKDFKGEFIVGTSSPRRITNLTRNLRTFLPYGKNYSLKCEMLRGNVNTRIKKLRDGNYHAITLALAGIERLAHGEKSRAELSELLEGMTYFVLPQSVFPSAASQGALGIETREDRNDGGKLLGIIQNLSHERTMEEVSRERTAFKEYGGGCHLAVGIHVKKIGDTFLHVHAGEVDQERIEKTWIEGVELKKTSGEIFIGLPHGDKDALYDEYLEKKVETKSVDFKNNVFVTSRYGIETLKASTNATGIWAAGSKTAELLTENGFWINGTSDSLGTEDLIQIKSSKAIKLMDPTLDQNWSVLTHNEGTTDLGKVIGVYSRVEKEVSKDFEERLKKVTACYWTSFPQYKAYMARFDFLKNADHYCGLGKTWQEFKKAKVNVTTLASMQDFYQLKG